MAGPAHDEFIEFSPFMMKAPPMIIVSETVPRLKSLLSHCELKPLARARVMRIGLTFIMHRSTASLTSESSQPG
jgi:hypothetical protein